MAKAGFETLTELLLQFPELHAVAKAYSPDYVLVPLTTITTPRDAQFKYRKDCKVRGIFVVTRAESFVRGSRCVIKQDYLVQWLNGRKPSLTYYSGLTPRLKKAARGLANIELRHIKQFCKDFGVDGDYGCEQLGRTLLPTHHYTRTHRHLPKEREWVLAFQFALAWARKKERARSGGPRKKTSCR